MTKKLLLINPAQHNRTNLATLLRLPPASLAYLVSLTPADWDIKIIDENVESYMFEEADLVAITAYTCNAPRGYEISQEYRQRGIKTVMGGVHVSAMRDEAIGFVDSVVVGEAESVWQEVLSDFEKGDMKPVYQGERTSLDNMVKPNRDLYSKRYRLLSVETSRGCPNDCEFCSVPAFYGRTYRQRPVNEVLDELEALKTKWFFFTDDNILGYGKKAEERAIQLFRGMIDRGIKKRWGCYVGIDFANNPEVMKYAKKAGCLGVFIGFESVSEEALEVMHKVRNLRVGVSNYREKIKRMHDYGIGVLGSFVLGNDGDRKDVFDKTTEFILNSNIDVVQLSILNPFPGTRLYERLKQEGRLLRTDYPGDWKYYDFMDVLFSPRHMTPEELSEGVARVYRDTTSRMTCLKRALISAVQTRDLLGSTVAYLGNRGAGTLWMKSSEQRVGM
ncbi:MAG: B12-binding domain-containing radical SAM protein [Dehalococcoidia bacterium]|nr:MAG: B12-binding domain-containing radical SAM protein [Dehalococcoidia bacterium]